MEYPVQIRLRHPRVVHTRMTHRMLHEPPDNPSAVCVVEQREQVRAQEERWNEEATQKPESSKGSTTSPARSHWSNADGLALTTPGTSVLSSLIGNAKRSVSQATTTCSSNDPEVQAKHTKPIPSMLNELDSDLKIGHFNIDNEETTQVKKRAFVSRLFTRCRRWRCEHSPRGQL